jgi:hypothetical protein
MVADSAGSAVSALMLMSIDAPLDEQLRDELAGIASERLDATFGG